MKKLFVIFTVLLLSSFAFAKPFDGGEEVVEKFLSKGSYVKVVSKNEINYYYKQTIASINIDGDKLIFRTVGTVENYSGRDTTEPEFDSKTFNIVTDEEGNIIITSKK